MGAVGSGIAGLFGAGTSAAQQSQDNKNLDGVLDQEKNDASSLMNLFNSSTVPTIQSLISGGMNGTGLLGNLSNLGTGATGNAMGQSGLAGALASIFPQFGALSGQMSGIASGLQNANLFPSAGMSAMKTMLSQDGSVANPGAQLQQLASTLGQQGMAGDIQAKQAALTGLGQSGSTLQQGLGTLTGAGGLLSDSSGSLNTAGNLGQLPISDITSLLGLQTQPLGSALGGLSNASNTYMNMANAAGQGVQSGISSALGNFSSPGAFGGIGSALGGAAKAAG